MISKAELQELPGSSVIDNAGERIGDVVQVYVSDESADPLFVTVKTGLFGTKESFVPLEGATFTDEGLRVMYAQSLIKDAPRIEADQHLSDDDQASILDYYAHDAQPATEPMDQAQADDRPMDETRTDRHDDAAREVTDERPMEADGRYEEAAPAEQYDDAAPAGQHDEAAPAEQYDESGPAGQYDEAAPAGQYDDAAPAGQYDEAVTPVTDDAASAPEATSAAPADEAAAEAPADGNAMTLSEERLNVGMEQVQTERIRLRKHIVTEERTVTVPVRREELRIEREPIDAADAVGTATELGEDVTEIVLSEERPVVQTEVVPTERVRITKDVVTDERQVSADVRHEEVDTDGGR